MSNQNIPRKGDIVINPNTQRPVKVGSRTWLKLVKKGIFEGRYTDPKELAPIRENNVDEQINELNQDLPDNVQAVRGRGRYKNKIVKRSKRPATEDVRNYTTDVAKKVVNDNIDLLADCDNLEEELERLILQEMAGGAKPKKRVGRPKKQPQTEEKYVLKETPQYDEYEEDYEQDEDSLIDMELPQTEEDYEQEDDEQDDDIDYFEDE